MKPHVGIFSDSNFLAIAVLENLLSKKYFVTIFTDNKNDWEDSVSHLRRERNFEIVEASKNREFSSIDYSFFILGFIDTKNLIKEISKISKYKFINVKKSILVLPAETYLTFQEYKIVPTDNIAVVYVSDLIGPRINLDSSLLFSRLIYSSLYMREIDVAVGERFYPVSVYDVARVLVGWLFSFGPYGKETQIIGQEFPTDTLWRELSRKIPNLKFTHNTTKIPRQLPRGVETKKLETNFRYVFAETLTWLSKVAHQKNFKLPKPKLEIKIGHIDPKVKKSVLLSLAAFILILSPFLISLISLGFLKLAVNNFIGGRSDKVKSLTYISKTAAVVGKYESRFFTHIPFLGRVYRESYFINTALIDVSDMGVTFTDLSKNSTELMSKIMGNEIYDPSIYVEKIIPDLDFIYRKLSILESETNTQSESGVVTAKKLIAKFDIGRYKLVAQEARTIIENLPEDLGATSSKTYLFLFQNNMELRPTGGFIGSYGILTFEGGRMTDISVSDVYSADGQLKGHIEPPAPIKKYLGEANWWLRDSNWDPDFITSGKRAEWFLDKEVDKKVDGVIGLDLETVKRLLTVTGPITLPDYNLGITSANLYEKTQGEIENKFFAGSTKKASFLTSLSRNLIIELQELTGNKRLEALKNIFDSLEERHIQIYQHNELSQESYTNLAWSGEVKVPTCTGDCYADLAGTVEANVGVNKANYYVTRKETLDVKINGNQIERTMAVDITNSANPNLGASGVYKNYMRFLTNGSSEINRAIVVSGESNEYVDVDSVIVKDRKENGMYVEIYPGQTKRIVFSWKDTLPTAITNQGEYRLYVRKQAGVGEFPLQIKVKNSSSLTNPAGVVYNTTLARDFFSRISW